MTTKLRELLTGSTPDVHGCPGRLWTTKKVRAVVAAIFAITCARSTLWLCLVRLGLAWKKTKKILAKANTAKRADYLDEFENLFDELRRGERTLIYIDEAHIHQDMDHGYGWAPVGRPHRVASTSPGLHAKINWYGAYDFTNGRALIWSYPMCNGANTADFLARVAEWARDRPRVTVIWDGSPVHRAIVARDRAAALDLELVVLPAYSPDLNPIEGLWKWLRESVTQGICHDSVEALFAASMTFIESINSDPLAMIQRLWPKMHLVAEEEALRLAS